MEKYVRKRRWMQEDKATPPWMVAAAAATVGAATAGAATDGIVVEKVESRLTKIREISIGQPPRA